MPTIWSHMRSDFRSISGLVQGREAVRNLSMENSDAEGRQGGKVGAGKFIAADLVADSIVFDA